MTGFLPCAESSRLAIKTTEDESSPPLSSAQTGESYRQTYPYCLLKQRTELFLIIARLREPRLAADRQAPERMPVIRSAVTATAWPGGTGKTPLYGVRNGAMPRLRRLATYSSSRPAGRRARPGAPGKMTRRQILYLKVVQGADAGEVARQDDGRDVGIPNGKAPVANQITQSIRAACLVSMQDKPASVSRPPARSPRLSRRPSHAHALPSATRTAGIPRQRPVEPPLSDRPEIPGRGPVESKGHRRDERGAG